jgi:hypothetical protein
MKGIAWLDTLSSDLRCALRGLSHHPSFSAAALLTLALESVRTPLCSV